MSPACSFLSMALCLTLSHSLLSPLSCLSQLDGLDAAYLTFNFVTDSWLRPILEEHSSAAAQRQKHATKLHTEHQAKSADVTQLRAQLDPVWHAVHQAGNLPPPLLMLGFHARSLFLSLTHPVGGPCVSQSQSHSEPHASQARCGRVGYGCAAAAAAVEELQAAHTPRCAAVHSATQ